MAFQPARFGRRHESCRGTKRRGVYVFRFQHAEGARSKPSQETTAIAFVLVRFHYLRTRVTLSIYCIVLAKPCRWDLSLDLIHPQIRVHDACMGVY
jgi:hypothetical protein